MSPTASTGWVSRSVAAADTVVRSDAQFIEAGEQHMLKWRRLGELERAIMEHLWKAAEPQTVRQVHAALSARRSLAYTTIMTVLQRLADKGFVMQDRNERAYRYVPTEGRDELVAGLMADALAHATDSASRHAALVHFVERVGTDEAGTLLRALGDLEVRHTAS